MKYALLIYGTPEAEARQQDDPQAIMDEYSAIFDAPGVLTGLRLEPVQTATTVRVNGGDTLLTDGPFVAAKEYLGGLYLLEADNLDAAIELAARVPAARLGGAVEVRPVDEQPVRVR
jgi:hypothetical protein